VAIAFSSVAAFAVVSWLRWRGFSTRLSPIDLAPLLLAPTLAGRLGVVAAPRATWRPAAPLAVAVGLVGGPVIGAWAGAATQLSTVGSVWRYRLTWGAVVALEGFAGGAAGLLRLPGSGGALVEAGLASLSFLVINQVAQVLVALDRRIRPRASLLRLGLTIDLAAACLLVPLLTLFLVAATTARLLALGGLAAAFVLVAVSDHTRRRVVDELATERLRARRDRLTGAPNRLALDEALRFEHGRILRGAQPAGLLFLDLDHFGEVNNRFGYAAGDRLLVAVYQRLRGQLRPSDLVCRWGGEEFVILAPELGGQRLLAEFAERIRRLVLEQPFLDADSQPLTITVSVGATILDGSALPAEIVDHASRLVRTAKHFRNTVIAQPPPPLSSTRFLVKPVEP
jgi:diguanylate cyclase (GGDEF)-like protein